jgi:hypothetical protein
MMNLVENAFVTFGNDIVVVNTTPHPVTIQDIDGTLKEVPQCGHILNGTPVERKVDDIFVKTEFVGNDEGRQLIKDIKTLASWATVEPYRLVIVGSIIAAEAYPGDAAAMTPVPGFERVPPQEKRMRCDKFTIF